MYTHAKGEPMHIEDIIDMVGKTNIPDTKDPCAHYKKIVDMKKLYIKQHGGEQLIKDSKTAQENKIENQKSKKAL